MELHYRAGDRVVSVRVEPGGGRFRVAVDGRAHDVEVRRAAGGEVDLAIDGRLVRAFVAESGPHRHVKVGDADAVAFRRAETRRERARPQAGGEEALTANMHAQVVAVRVKEGDRVERGQTLVVLEAMKMELRVQAPHAGRVKLVACREGEIVERGRVLLEIVPEPAGGAGAAPAP